MFPEVSKVAKKKLAAANSLQLGIEKGLRSAAWVLAVMHGLLSAFRFVIDTKPFEQAEKWFALILLVSALAYLLMTKIKYPQTMYRIKGFFRSFKSYEQFFLIALFLWYAIICWIWQNINHLNYLRGLDFYILDTGIAALVLFPMTLYAGKGKARIYVESFLHVVCIAYTIFAGWCMWHVFHLNIITLPSGSQVGLTSSFTLLIGCHYNITGAISFTILAISCYMIVTQKIYFKVIYGIGIIIHLWVCMLTNSRTVYICVLFLGAATVFFLLWNALREKNIIIRIIAAASAAGAVALVIWWFRGTSFEWFDSITNFKVLAGLASSNAPAAASEALPAQSDVRELTSLSGRQAIWMGALKTMTATPETFFFGVTPAKVTEALKTYGGLPGDFAHAHNAVLQIGTSMGVPAMIAYFVFIIIMVIKSIRSYLTLKGAAFRNYYMIPIITAGLVVMNLTEAYVYFSAMNTIFFVVCGLLTYGPVYRDDQKRNDLIEGKGTPGK